MIRLVMGVAGLLMFLAGACLASNEGATEVPGYVLGGAGLVLVAVAFTVGGGKKAA